jgi:thioredoxin reductase
LKSYDVIVIGAGDVGLGIAFKAASAGLKVRDDKPGTGKEVFSLNYFG